MMLDDDQTDAIVDLIMYAIKDEDTAGPCTR